MGITSSSIVSAENKTEQAHAYIQRSKARLISTSDHGCQSKK